MKVAFHFDSACPEFGNPCGTRIESLVFGFLLKRRGLQISSKIYRGDLPLNVFCPDLETRVASVEALLKHSECGWRGLTSRFTKLASETDGYVLCFDSITRNLADYLHEALRNHSGYLGAIQVNDAVEIFWELYSDVLELKYRITDKQICVIDDGLGDEPSSDEHEEDARELISIGFSAPKFESSEGKHSFFDKYHNFEQARRIAEWKDQCGDLLAFMADGVVSRLGDTTPKLADMLFEAMHAFERAETDEAYSQCCGTCRRIIEHVADTLYPPTDATRNGRAMGEANHRNRLLAYVEDHTKSESTAGIIIGSWDLFVSQVESIQNLASKGVHKEILREGARRCLLRTIFLLDDIVAVTKEGFKIKTDLDFSILEQK